MSVNMPFLAVPIKARISAEGCLTFADPAIWRLHRMAGGEADGPVAIAGLATLAALCLRTRMAVERPVRAVDQENDVELWVEAQPDSDHADISIMGWRDIVAEGHSFRPRKCVEPNSADGAEILIDPQLRLVRVPGFMPDDAIGKHLGSLFILEVDDKGGIPLVNLISERKAVNAHNVGISGNGERYILDFMPQFAPDGSYVGHAGTLKAVENAVSVLAAPAVAADLPMGRQFASVLKQPLSRIVANAETIGSKIYGPLRDNYAEYAQDIANAARHLSELVADMEDLEAIDRTDFSVARDRIELGDVARRVAGLLALKASDHGIKLALPMAKDTVEAIGEFRRVLQILLNLVGNAIRYAPDGSTVTIATERQGDFAAIQIADEGQGIADEDRERVFEKFERLGRSGDGGSGLGLYISRRLARAMGGDLTIGKAPTGGAVFQLTLPAL